MDRGKRHVKTTNYNSKIYLDLKDIVRENALQFLPAKALIKCTSVCRDWKLVITNPFFAHRQSFSFKGFSGLFFQNSCEPLRFVPIDSKTCGVPDSSLSFLPVPVVVRCASNGLVCCQDSSKVYYICNPVTKQWKKLPKQDGDHGDDPALVLIFEPSLLGFEAEYQLVCGFNSSELDGLEFEIYSSKKGSWKISGEICFGRWKLNPVSGVYASGVVYWMTNHSSIFAFDLAKDRSFTISGRYPVGVLSGKLCSFNFTGHDLTIEVLSNAHTNTMSTNSREPGWKRIRQVKMHVIGDTNGGNSATGDKTGVMKLQMSGKDNYGLHRESVLFANHDMVVLKNEKRVVALDLKTNVASVLMTFETGFDSSTRLVPYVNSLISL